MDFGYLQEDDAEEYYAFLERMEERVRKRKAAEMSAPEDRPLLEAKQAVSNVKDFYRPDKKQKSLRKCSRCGKTGHNKATCPLAPAPDKENQDPEHDGSGAASGDP